MVGEFCGCPLYVFFFYSAPTPVGLGFVPSSSPSLFFLPLSPPVSSVIVSVLCVVPALFAVVIWASFEVGRFCLPFKKELGGRALPTKPDDDDGRCPRASNTESTGHREAERRI